MMDPWRITLFGGLQARHGEQVVTRFKTQKVASLFAYLAYHLRQNRVTLRLLLRLFHAAPEPELDAFVRLVATHFDQGTQRAILRLHRAASEPRLAELGTALAGLDSPALIVWGERDRWLAPELAERYAARLPNATVEIVADAGHWPWLDRPDTVELIARFLER